MTKFLEMRTLKEEYYWSNIVGFFGLSMVILYFVLFNLFVFRLSINWSQATIGVVLYVLCGIILLKRPEHQK